MNSRAPRSADMSIDESARVRLSMTAGNEASNAFRRSSSALCTPGCPRTLDIAMPGYPRPYAVARPCAMKPSQVKEEDTMPAASHAARR